MLLEITMSNLEPTANNTHSDAITALNSDMADGVLSDPDEGSGLIQIPVVTIPVTGSDTLASNGIALYDVIDLQKRAKRSTMRNTT